MSIHHKPGGHPLDAELDALNLSEVPIGVAADSTSAAPLSLTATPGGAGGGAGENGEASGSKIRTFEQRLGGGQAQGEAGWKRKARACGTGAVHVKSFHCKLTGDSLEFLDQQINDWLDAHPGCDVKNVTTTVGEWSGKLREPALIVNVWI